MHIQDILFSQAFKKRIACSHKLSRRECHACNFYENTAIHMIAENFDTRWQPCDYEVIETVQLKKPGQMLL